MAYTGRPAKLKQSRIVIEMWTIGTVYVNLYKITQDELTQQSSVWKQTISLYTEVNREYSIDMRKPEGE